MGEVGAPAAQDGPRKPGSLLTATSVEAEVVGVEAWALLAALPPPEAWTLPLVEEEEPLGVWVA